MKIEIQNVIEFFDYTSDHGHATSIVGLIGEDLNAWAFKNYMGIEMDAEVKILDIPVTTGHQKGKRLDRWIYVKENDKEVLYQCEIKNWSSTAIHGKKLKLNANAKDKYEIANYYWELQKRLEFSDKIFPNGVTKVLVEMKIPDQYKELEIRPLIIYWMPISNTEELKPFFKVRVSDFNNSKIQSSFKELYIFSVSLYLREMKDKGHIKIIEIDNNDMPNVDKRLKVLNKIIV